MRRTWITLVSTFLLVSLPAVAETKRQQLTGTIDLANANYLDHGDCLPGGGPWCVNHPNREYKGQFRVDFELEYETRAVAYAVESRRYLSSYADHETGKLVTLDLCEKRLRFRFGRARVALTDLATGKPLSPMTEKDTKGNVFEKNLEMHASWLGDKWTTKEACNAEEVDFGPYDETIFMRAEGLSVEIAFHALKGKVIRLARTPDVFGALDQEEPFAFEPKGTIPIGELSWLFFDASNPTPENTKTTTLSVGSSLVLEN